MQVVPIKASSSFLKEQILWVFLADKSIESSLFMSGQLGVPKFCRYMLMFQKSCPAGRPVSTPTGTTPHGIYLLSLHCTFLIKLFSHSFSSCSLLSLCLHRTHPSLQKNCFHLAWICVACVDCCLPLTKNTYTHSFNWCSYRSKPMWNTKDDIFYSLHAFPCNKISLGHQAPKT